MSGVAIAMVIGLMLGIIAGLGCCIERPSNDERQDRFDRYEEYTDG